MFSGTSASFWMSRMWTTWRRHDGPIDHAPERAERLREHSPGLGERLRRPVEVRGEVHHLAVERMDAAEVAAAQPDRALHDGVEDGLDVGGRAG